MNETFAQTNGRGEFLREKFLTKKEVAELCDITPKSVDRWMSKGLLPYYKIGRTVRFKLADIEKHFADSSRVLKEVAA